MSNQPGEYPQTPKKLDELIELAGKEGFRDLQAVLLTVRGCAAGGVQIWTGFTRIIVDYAKKTVQEIRTKSN
jgi:hypothetical protein